MRQAGSLPYALNRVGWRARPKIFASSIIRQESRGGGGGEDFSVVVSPFLRRRKTRKIEDLSKNCAEILSWTLGE
jgi:hypothetical protein